MILLFVHLLGMEDVLTSGTAKLVILASNMAALASLLVAGDVLWILGIPAGLCAMAGAYWGSKLTLPKSAGMVRGVMLAVLVLLPGGYGFQADFFVRENRAGSAPET